MSKFSRELEELINKHSLENESNTPDFILANYILNSLMAYTTAVNERTLWYGGKHPSQQFIGGLDDRTTS